ncbi:MAG: chorismate lyase [Ketobacteraceae bacterium]|nr:chorismate lyase [Ketobacteraceae bacterium]
MSSFAPQSQLSGLLKSLAFRGVPRFQVPRAYRDWLFDAGSLTRRLVQATNGDFRVQVLRQYHGPPMMDEQTALGVGHRTLPFIREVNLMCHGEPWVYARTVIPRSTQEGPGRYLTRLGNKPLGVALFNDPNIRRGEIHVKQLPADALDWGTPITQPIWGRHSLFYLYGEPLLISEYFLPGCPMYHKVAPGEVNAIMPDT